jgi:hypothetical protein
MAGDNACQFEQRMRTATVFKVDTIQAILVQQQVVGTEISMAILVRQQASI